MSLFNKKAAQAKRDLRAKMKDLRKRLVLLDHPAVREAYNLFPLNIRSKVAVKVSEYGDTVNVSLMLSGLDSFKDKRLVNSLAAFSGAEWEASSSDWTGGSEPNRDFFFSRRIDGFSISVNIFAFVKSDSPTCRIVVKEIKTEVKTEEVRAIVCD